MAYPWVSPLSRPSVATSIMNFHDTRKYEGVVGIAESLILGVARLKHPTHLPNPIGETLYVELD